jgi:hypothetical protein
MKQANCDNLACDVPSLDIICYDTHVLGMFNVDIALPFVVADVETGVFRVFRMIESPAVANSRYGCLRNQRYVAHFAHALSRGR